MLAVAAGVAMLAPAAALATSALRIRGAGPFALATMTLAAAMIVALTLVLSAFGAYEREAMLLGQLVLLLAVVTWWLAAGRPPPPVPALPSRAQLVAAARANGTVALLLAAVAIASLVELVLALAIVPNSWDSMMYHLSRVALWIQEGSVFGLEGGTIYELQHQPNGEILYGWTLLLSDGDRLAAVVPWLSALGCGGLVCWGARMLGFPVAAAAFAGAMFLLLPQIVVQASSTLVDLSAAFFVGAFALFGVRAIRDASWGDLVIASAALGLAVGTKGTAFLAVPALLLILGGALLRRRLPWRAVALGAAALAAGALLLGGSYYVQNTIETGSPAGDAGESQTRTSPLRTTAQRTLWTFVDIPGLAGTLPAQALQPVHDRVWPNGVDPFNDTYVSEDGIGFGPLVPLLLLPLLVYYALGRRAPPARRIVAFAAASFIAAYAVVLETGPNASHTLVTGVLIGAPLLARAAEVAWLRHVAAFVSIVFLVPVLLQNQMKPLYPDSVIGLDRPTQQSLQHAFEPALSRIDEVLAPDARIAYIGPSDATWDYPFFGPGLDRYVYRLQADPGAEPSAAEVDAMVAERDLDAVVWAGLDPLPRRPVTELGDIAFSNHVVWLVDGPPGGEL